MTLSKRAVLMIGFTLICGPAAPVAMAGESIATGPEVGVEIPDFEARDQSGRMRRFEDLRGPEGLLLLFHRTADW